jgi:hypothetical protein
MRQSAGYCWSRRAVLSMAKRRVPKRLRDRLATAARHCCGYCLTSELITGAPLEVDHLMPESKGGTRVEESLRRGQWCAYSILGDKRGRITSGGWNAALSLRA